MATALLSILFLVTSDEHSTMLAHSSKDLENKALEQGIQSIFTQMQKNTPGAEIGGMARRVEYFTQTRKENERQRVCVVSAGDFLEGPVFEAFRGDLDVEMMNQAGYDVVTLGNHEFSLGAEALLQLLRKKAQFPIVVSNIFEKNEQGELETIFPPYHIVENGQGEKIAFIGIMGRSSWESIRPSHRGSLVFGDPQETLKGVIAKVKEEVQGGMPGQPLYIVLLSHSGIQEDRQLAEHVPGIDLLLGGHSHTLMEQVEYVGSTPIMHSFCHGDLVSSVQLAAGKVLFSGVEVLDSRWDPKSQAALNVERTLTDKLVAMDNELKRPLGRCGLELSNQEVREHLVPLGKVLCEEIRCCTETPADIAFVLGGSIAHGFSKGQNISLKDVKELFVSIDTIWRVEARGEWIQKMMEENEKRWGKSKQFQYSGLDISNIDLNAFYTIHATSFFFERELMMEDGKTIKPAYQDQIRAIVPLNLEAPDIIAKAIMRDQEQGREWPSSSIDCHRGCVEAAVTNR